MAPLVRTAAAQGPTFQEIRRVVEQLDTDFWERSWMKHLQDEVDGDGSIDWEYDDRQRLSGFAGRYRRAIEDAEGLWVHPQVQDYLQRRLLAVQPNAMLPGRPGAFSVQILRTTAPNALAFSDGTVFLTTGLLASLSREEELEALLAHEVAHVVLDHALSNYRSGEQWDRTQNLLGRIAGGVASIVSPLGGGGASAPESEYGLKEGLAGEFLDPEIVEAAGLEYDDTQEQAANRLARRWLRIHDRPASFLHSALEKARRASLFDRTGRGAAFSDLHPVPESLQPVVVTTADSTTQSLPPPKEGERGRSYDTQMAALLEQEAELEIAARRYRPALATLRRATRADWTRPEVYLLKAHALRQSTEGTEEYDRALALLDTADALTEAPEPRIDSERALLHLRQGQTEAAQRSLKRCIEAIDQLREDTPSETPASAYAPETGRSAGAGDVEAGPETEGERRLYATLRAWAAEMTERLSHSSAGPSDQTQYDR